MSNLDKVLSDFSELTTELEEEYSSKYINEPVLGIRLPKESLDILILGFLSAYNHTVDKVKILKDGGIDIKLKKG